MGYLNGDTITVDAILTKHGRKVLAERGSLDIRQFALSDDGVDYRLWNTAHPSGSDNYGEAINNLQNLKAVPTDRAMMKYKLTTLPRSTRYLPYIRTNLSGNVIALDRQGKDGEMEVVIDTINGTDKSYTITVGDSSFTSVSGVTMKDISGAIGGHKPYSTEIPITTQYKGKKPKFRALPLKQLARTEVTITGDDTGATATFILEAQENTRILPGR